MSPDLRNAWDSVAHHRCYLNLAIGLVWLVVLFNSARAYVLQGADPVALVSPTLIPMAGFGITGLLLAYALGLSGTMARCGVEGQPAQHMANLVFLGILCCLLAAILGYVSLYYMISAVDEAAGISRLRIAFHPSFWKPLAIFALSGTAVSWPVTLLWYRHIVGRS